MEVNTPSATTSWAASVFKARMNTHFLRIPNLWNVCGIQGVPHNIPAPLEEFSEVPQNTLTCILYIPAKLPPAGKKKPLWCW